MGIILSALISVVNCLLPLQADRHTASAAWRARLPYPTATQPPTTPHAALHHRRVKPKFIALTFDDGPQPYYTHRVLQLLGKYHIHATFFVIGRQAATYPDLVRAEAAAQDEVENHTWSHANLRYLSWADAEAQIAATADEVQLLTGRAPRYLRPPYGSVNAAVRAEAQVEGERTVLWTVDPRDWARPGAWFIVNNIETNVRAGSIVILHDGGGRRDETLTALNTVIPRLLARGFRFVTLQQLLEGRPVVYPHMPIHPKPRPRLRRSQFH